MRVSVIQPTVNLTLARKKVCAYARVSTGSQLQEESLDNQVTYYENLIKNNPSYEYVGVFADQGITGTTSNRPAFQRMLNMARSGNIDLIITKSISRFSRNTTDMLETVRELKELNVEVEFQKENIKTLSGDGELRLTILSSFAQEEAKNMSENQKWAIRNKFKRGELMINTERFLGYDKDEYGELVINQEEAKIVQFIFTEYLNGKGVFTIAKELNGEGVPTVGRARWHDSTILGILKNEKYKGDAHLQKTYTPGDVMNRSYKNNGEVDSYYIEENHPPIVSNEMWDKVQEELKRRAKVKGNLPGDTKKYQNRYPLTGMLYCSKCGYSLIRRTWNSKLSCRKIVWQCSNYIRNGKVSCTGTRVDNEIVSDLNINEETIVEEVIKNGKKDYVYTSRSRYQSSPKSRTTKEKNGSLL